MRFDRAKDPAAAASKEGTRYAINGVAVVEREGHFFLAATDGRSLTLVRAYPDDRDDTYAGTSNARVYPVAAFAAARKAGKRKAEAALMLNGAAHVNSDGAHTEFAILDRAFPDVVNVIPKGEPVATVKLNAEYLARLQEALGANGVEVRLHGAGLPLTIVPVYTDAPGQDDGSIAMLMPIGGGGAP